MIKQQFFRVIKRPEMSGGKIAFYYMLAILLSIAAGGLFILALGVNPFAFYHTVVTGCFKSRIALVATIRIIMPLLITSLGVSIAFQMKFWNIGAEGQFIMGAVCASYVALFYADALPHWLLMLLMAAAGMIGGGFWGYITAFFKCKYNTNETLLTLMLNYIALYIVQYLADGPWRDPAAGGFPKITRFPKNAYLDQILGVDITWVIALVLVVIIFVYLKYTKHGYEIAVVGDSKNTAAYAGMNVSRIIKRTMFISAMVCGLGGMLQVSGDATSHTLTTGIASGVGFTAIIVAWLAKLNPFGVLTVSIMLGILQKGSGVAKSTFFLSPAVADLLQGIILFVILGSDFFIRYRLIRNKANNAGRNNK